MPILKTIQQHTVLLDTHVLLWYVTRNNSLKTTFLTTIDAAKEESILISPMTIWEIGMLVEKKRIELEMDVSTWIDKLLAHAAISLAAITPEIALLSTRLPLEAHGDPVDRMLIATAHITHSVLVTCDTKILQYGKDRFISVYNPQKT